ncbi:MAG: TonB-dependent receptor [Chitinophagaceae bacterium]|nr:TonB-dependent receptor [Chitinophagaceae bacterium]
MWSTSSSCGGATRKPAIISGNPSHRYGTGGSWGGVAMGTISGDLIDDNIRPGASPVTKEAGIDFRAADNRIAGEFTVYSKNHINQIQPLPVLRSTGNPYMLTNMGSVKSNGIEAALTVTPVRTKDWRKPYRKYHHF